MHTDADKVIRLRRWSWEPESEIEVTLRPSKYSDAEWHVLLDGKDIGRVDRYTGSLDRKYKGSRLRHPGKRRTLWSVRGPGKDDYGLYGYVSRAEAIRWLLSGHENRQSRR